MSLLARRLSVGASFTGATGYAATIIGDSPVAYYRLGETSGTTAADEIASADASYAGSYTLNQTGLVDDADPSVDLDPSSRGRIVIPDLNITGDWSIEWWCKPDAIDFDRRIFDSDLVIGLRINGSNLEYFDGGGSGSWQVFGAHGISNGSIFQMAVSVASDVMTAYVNGSALGSTVSAPGEILNAELRFGDRNPSFGVSWDGDMDEISCWDRALSGSEVSDHYDAGTA